MDMKQFSIIFVGLMLSACKPAIDRKPAPTLQSYEASEFEPNWALKLSDGNLIEFTQLNPETGADMVTDRYEVISQTQNKAGWRVEGEGPRGSLIFETQDTSDIGGCTHSGSGETYRDQITVTSPRNNWRGCGGPKL